MRKRLLSALAVSLLGVLALAVPGAATAAPHHNRGLTIAATPDPITAGEGVLIYGELKGIDNGGQRILLFHRINPAAQFTLIGRTRTNASGYYEFVRADGVVKSNRNWYVVGPGGTHSRTVHELVSSVLTLSANDSTATTGEQVQFTGTVFPNHPRQRVLLQEQSAVAGNGWRTVASAFTSAGSSFTIEHAFRAAGSYTLRAYLAGDARNTPGQSTPVTLTVEQLQNQSFTINASDPVITDGQTETISGALYAAGSTTTQPNVPVTLYGKLVGGSFKVLATTMTDGSGDYSFDQVPLHNTVYRVTTASGAAASTAKLYVGVEDVITISASASSVGVGESVTISGVVAPAHAGHVVNLQRQNARGNWVDVESRRLAAGSSYSFSYPFGQPGAVSLRVQVPGGPVNLGGVSTAVTITVSGLAPVSSLPPAS